MGAIPVPAQIKMSGVEAEGGRWKARFVERMSARSGVLGEREAR